MLKIVDENVLIIANDLTRMSLGKAVLCAEADELCRTKCADALLEIIENGGAVLDDETEFFDKYKSHTSFDGQPGVGDAFFRFLYERGYDKNWVTRVPIKDNGNYLLPQSFVESKFHDDDYLWVAAAYNSPSASTILNACDSDYKNEQGALSAINVSVSELCTQA